MGRVWFAVVMPRRMLNLLEHVEAAGVLAGSTNQIRD